MLILSLSLRTQLAVAARAAYPREACGLLEGVRVGDAVTVTAIHPAPNLSSAPGDAFVIDPAAQFALQRALRGSGRAVIGCYHSHPDGQAVPSPRDRANGCPEEFIWIILATGVSDSLAAFEGPDFRTMVVT